MEAHQNLEWLALKMLNKSLLESIKREKLAQTDGRHDSAGAIAPSGWAVPIRSPALDVKCIYPVGYIVMFSHSALSQKPKTQ